MAFQLNHILSSYFFFLPLYVLSQCQAQTDMLAQKEKMNVPFAVYFLWLHFFPALSCFDSLKNSHARTSHSCSYSLRQVFGGAFNFFLLNKDYGNWQLHVLKLQLT